MMKKMMSVIFSALIMSVIFSAGDSSEVKAAESAATSGQCGENAYWNYDAEAKTLTISGTGDIGQFRDLEDETAVKTVVIGKDLTGIDYEDYGISIPFTGYASLEKFEVDTGNSYLTAVDGVLYDKNMKELLSYPAGKKDKTFTVPSGVEEILGGFDEDLTYLNHLILPESVKSINFGRRGPVDTLTYMTIYSRKFEFNHDEWVFPNNIIYGYTGSDAEAFAKSMGAAFIPLDKKTVTKVKVSGISISGISKKIAAGKKIQLSVNVTPANAASKAVKWTSGDAKTATVDNTGLVTLNKNSGGKSITITAEATDGSGVKAAYKITSMKGVVKKVTVTGSKSVKAGKSIKLKAKVKISKGANKKLKWTSSNTKYAKVSSSGKVKTYKAGKEKTVKITAAATDGSNKKKTFKLKIR